MRSYQEEHLKNPLRSQISNKSHVNSEILPNLMKIHSLLQEILKDSFQLQTTILQCSSNY